MSIEEKQLKRTLVLLLRNVNKIGDSVDGLCHLSEVVILNQRDYQYFSYFLELNLPAKNSIGFCWSKGQIEPRKAWLLEQIKIINLREASRED